MGKRRGREISSQPSAANRNNRPRATDLAACGQQLNRCFGRYEVTIFTTRSTKKQREESAGQSFRTRYDAKCTCATTTTCRFTSSRHRLEQRRSIFGTLGLAVLCPCRRVSLERHATRISGATGRTNPRCLVRSLRGQRSPILSQLGVKIAGNPPASLSLKDEGDAAFERSRAVAQAELDRIADESHNTRDSACLVEKLYEIKMG